LGHPAATGIPTGFQAGPDHLRDYYVDTKEVPMQGPFTERHVGGYAHRHVGVNTTASLNPLADNTHPHKFGLPQAWYLYPFPAGSEIYYTIVNPTFVSSRQLRADFSRETIAKRPVNIKNIQTITSSIINDYGALNPIGNYTHNYEIVQIADRSVNNRYFVENNGILATPTASISVFGLKDYEVPDRGRHASIMVNRFSAPGGPEINSAGFLDFESETYSVYNALPFRNLTVRQPLNSFLTAHSLFGGYSSLYGEPSASYHKVQRNGAKRIEYTEEKVYDVGAAITTASSYDNFWVQHMIPQSDLQYNWITASAIQAPFGYSQPDLSNASEASTDLVFVSASLTGAHQVGGGMIPVDFVGLNSTVLSTLSTFDNLIETTSSTDLFASNAEISSELLLNSINLNRNGAGGFSSWKQIRNSYNPFVRYWNKNNYISIMTQSFVGIASGNPKKQKNPKLFRDPAVSFNHKPLKHNFTLTNGSDIVVKHTYGNNLHTFNSKTINKLIDFEAQRGDEVYDDLKRIYIDKDLGDFSPIQTFNGLQYSEAIFPRNLNTGLARTRSRENYTVSSGSANFDLRIGDSVAFWKDNIDNRLRTKNVAINASNQTIYSASNSAPAFKGGLFGMIDLSAWPLDSEEPFFDYYMYSASSGDATDQGYDPYAWVPMDTSLASRQLDPDATGGERWKNLSKNGELSNAAYIYGLYDYAIGGKSEQLDYPNALRSGRLPQFLTARRNNVRPSGSLQFEYPNLVWSGSFPYGQRFDNAYNENPGTTNLAFMTVQCSASLHLIPPYRTDVLSGKRPWYNSYEEYSQDIKLMSKNYSILPEFRITEHMDYYLDQGFSTENNKFLDLVGCSLDNTSSANTETGGFQNQFFTLYSNSDFMSKFVELKNDHKKGMAASPSKIRLKVNAVKKLLPYNGFYPALRSVQLGSMFSSSYAPYISGSRAFADNEAPYQRLAALNQPFFAPGIFFNTIKSGIAVDYAVHTGSAPRSLNDFSSFVASIVGVDTEYSCSNLALGLIADEPNYVFPFEAILNPNGYLPLTASQNEATYDDVLDGTGYASGSVYFVYPHFTSSLDVANAAAGAVDPWLGYTSGLAQRPEHFFTWHGESDIKYSLAANNFFAEVENFFLERQAPTSFISKAEKDFKTMASGNVYIMDVVLSKTDKFISYEGPSGSFKFHPFTGSSGDDADGSNRLGRGRLINPYVSARGMHYGPPYLPHLKMLGSPEGEQAWFEDPCFAPHTPPYFYGDAVARIEFRAGYDLEPGESRKYSLQDILANAEVKYFNTNTRAFDFANNKEVVGILAGNYPAYRNQMQISSSVDLLGSLTLKQTKYSSQQDEDGNFIPDGVDTTILQDSQDSWVIESKFECPSINLYNMDVDSLGAAPGNGNEKYYTRGIWKGYGTPPRGSEGIFLQLREAMPQTSYSKAQTLTGSLIDVCGFKPDKVRVGEIASTRQISEAVVAIPVNSDGEFYNVDSAMFLQQLININNGDPAIKKDQFGATEDIKSTSISDMIKKMKKFYIPPQFDPINNSKAKPVVMYIFEFNHELTKTDLADIWQNLMPEIATKAEKDSSVIEHNLRSKFEFFGNEGYSNSPFMSLNNDIRWMVFKVKQRGKNNYTNVTKKSEVSSGFSFTANKELAKFTSAPDKELPYSYNWPYDFFSLVELAEVESTVEFAPPNAPNVSKIQGLIESTETKVGSMGTGLVNPIMQGTSTTDQAPTQNSATTPVGAANLISPPIASPKTSTAIVDDAELTEF
jgi:hypothetical protein